MRRPLIERIRSAAVVKGLKIVSGKYGVVPDYSAGDVGFYRSDSGEACPLMVLLIDKPIITGNYLDDLRISGISESLVWCYGYTAGFDGLTPTLDELLESDFSNGFSLGKRHAKILL